MINDELRKPNGIPQEVWEGLNDCGKRNLAEWSELVKDAAHRQEMAVCRLEVHFGLREEGARIVGDSR